MGEHGHGSVEVECAGGCGTTVHRHPQRANKVSFSACSPKCRAKVNGLRSQKVTDEQVIASLLEHLNDGKTKADISRELGINRATFNARVKKLRKQGMRVRIEWHSSVG